MKKVLILLIDAYKVFISPMLPAACRFEPTCSIYTKNAIEKHGIAKGMWLGIKRVLRCHPFSRGGYDPVP